MSKKKEFGRWPEFADATGIDAKYAQDQAKADKELADATAGPDDSIPVPTDDTGMKNPHGEFQSPSTMTPPPNSTQKV